MSRVTIGDLNFAIEWLEAYDAEGSPKEGASIERVADMLRAEIRSRKIDEVVRAQGDTIRAYAEKKGIPLAKARAHFRKRLVEQIEKTKATSSAGG